MTKVKICGITRIEDALHAVACGADMLGFNFYSGSPRYISPEAARPIVEAAPAKVQCVGVFVNEMTPSAVRRIATEAGVKSVQLHGDESAPFCAALNDMNVIKVFRLGPGFDKRELANFSDYTVLLDSASRSYGGSGVTLDWELAAQVRNLVPRLILAGGLTDENVGRAISVVRPYAVDACSLLESSPGVKDHKKVQKFIAAVRAADSKAALVAE